MKIEDLYFDLPSEPVDEENWDLETWRKEHPMDYFKALHILEMADIGAAQAEIFKQIYQVIRLHVPDILYKYYSLSDNEALNMQKFQTLHDGKIYMSDIKDFNDPFDGKGFFYDATKLADIDRLTPHGGRMIDDFNRFIKGTCLSANGVQSMPMWAHYSSNHRGFCVSYDMYPLANGLLKLRFPLPVDHRLKRRHCLLLVFLPAGCAAGVDPASPRRGSVILSKQLQIEFYHMFLLSALRWAIPLPV